ncbi:hypothetical protein IFM46972_08242 [Aspergillus udagawae]|uniref:Uncharacterized protein n=1 Tax=Aspergillus udagawae TaxID=91492 RepID=A0A8H3S262_9EURO|nr:hypothetical protein IFM46972_08242 [Aspergillus udagawae]
MLILVLCFESACFTAIFTLVLRGLGNHTKRGGSMLIAAISGGAAIPTMTGAVATKTGNFHTAVGDSNGFLCSGVGVSRVCQYCQQETA